jgi:hypothetical protein
MNLREALLKEHSRRQTLLIASHIGDNQKAFDALVKIFLNDEYRVVQRAAWALSYCGTAYPSLLKKHFRSLIDNLDRPGLHDAVKRNTLRVFEDVEIPEKYLGKLVDHCFRFLNSTTEAIAIKAFSITILVNACERYPELRDEVKPLLCELLNHDAPAIISRAKKGLKLLGKQQIR